MESERKREAKDDVHGCSGKKKSSNDKGESEMDESSLQYWVKEEIPS